MSSNADFRQRVGLPQTAAYLVEPLRGGELNAQFELVPEVGHAALQSNQDAIQRRLGTSRAPLRWRLPVVDPTRNPSGTTDGGDGRRIGSTRYAAGTPGPGHRVRLVFRR